MTNPKPPPPPPKSSVPILVSARVLARRNELQDGPEKDAPDWAELLTVDVDPRDEHGFTSNDAYIAGSYWARGVAGFLATGEAKRLATFNSEKVAGYPLVTTPAMIEDFYERHGTFDFQEYYKP